jgi:hypothetical protein
MKPIIMVHKVLLLFYETFIVVSKIIYLFYGILVLVYVDYVSTRIHYLLIYSRCGSYAYISYKDKKKKLYIFILAKGINNY